MSNSFNISVKPEIAALEVKVDAVKNDTGPIRNDVTAIHDTNLPAVKNDTGPIRNDVTAIHDTMLPSVLTNTNAIRNDVTDIHDTDLPSVKTDTGAIRNDVDDIKVKTDALPQTVRGHFTVYGGYVNTDSWTANLNITGQGKLYMMGIQCKDAADTLELRITIDGKLSEVISHTGDAVKHWVVPTIDSPENAEFWLMKVAAVGSDVNLFNVDFDTSLLVELRRSAGTANWVAVKVVYSLDGW